MEEQNTPTAPIVAPSTAPTSELTPAAAAATTAAPAPEQELIDIEHFFKVKLKVAQIMTAEKIEKSKKLLKLQVDLGPELGTRQILSGIAQFYTPEQLIGQRIVVVTNLKPAKMMGLESQGMLLAASNADHSALTIVNPGQDVPLGASVS